MSLFEITSLDSDYKLFDDDPFLLDPDDSCPLDDGSDEADSLTGSLSSATQSQPSPMIKRQHVGIKHVDLADSPIIKQEVLTHDVYLEVHNYCIGTSASSIRSTASSPGLRESNNSIDVVSDEVHEEDSYDMDDEEIDCDEDDDDLIKSLKSSSSTCSPTSVGHRRKSMMDKSLSEEEKRLLLKEGSVYSA